MERRTVKSALRTFEVLELFQKHQRPLRLQEIYAQLNLPQSSTTNLLKSMLGMGYLNYNRGTRAYFPTTRVSALGNWLPKIFYSNGRLKSLAQKLQRRTDETVGICSQNDLFIQYEILCEPEHEFKMAPPEGSLRMMVDSVSGLALLSGMSDRQIDKICRYTNYYQLCQRDTFYERGGARRISTQDVLKEIEWIKHVGYAYRTGAPTPELASIAIPLNCNTQGIPLTVGVGGLKDRIESNKSAILEAMRELVAEFHAESDSAFGTEPSGGALRDLYVGRESSALTQH